MRWFFGSQDDGSEGSAGRSVPLSQTDFTVFDLEMTGLSPARDSIVSMGAVRMRGPSILLGESFSALVRPRTEMRGESVVVHGLTPVEAEAGRDAEEVLPEFLDFCGSSVLVGWRVAMDAAFLGREARRQGLAVANPYLDAAELCRFLRGSRASALLESLPARDVDLYDLAALFGIETKGAHDALADAFIAAQLFQRFLALLETDGDGAVRLDLAGLMRAGNPFAAATTGRGNPCAQPFNL